MVSITIRIPDELYEKIDVEALKEHRSKNGQIIYLLEKGLEKEQK